MLSRKNMTAARIKQLLEDLKNNPKIDILYTFKGLAALNRVKKIEFPLNPEEADKWVRPPPKKNSRIWLFIQD